MCRAAGIDGIGKPAIQEKLLVQPHLQEKLHWLADSRKNWTRKYGSFIKYKRTNSIQQQLVSDALQPPLSIAIGGSTSSQPLSSTDQPSATVSELQLMRDSKDKQTTKKPKLMDISSPLL